MKKGIVPVLLFALLTYCLPLISLLLPAARADGPSTGVSTPKSSPMPSTSQGLIVKQEEAPRPPNNPSVQTPLLCCCKTPAPAK